MSKPENPIVYPRTKARESLIKQIQKEAKRIGKGNAIRKMQASGRPAVDSMKTKELRMFLEDLKTQPAATPLTDKPKAAKKRADDIELGDEPKVVITAGPKIFYPKSKKPQDIAIDELKKLNPGVGVEELWRALEALMEKDLRDRNRRLGVDPLMTGLRTLASASGAAAEQIGGDHYKQFTLQPAEIATRNGLSFLEGSVVKRMHRHSRGGKGLQDLQKAIHEIRLIAKWQYNEDI